MSRFIIDDVEVEIERDREDGDIDYALATCTIDVNCERQDPDPNTWASDVDFYGYEEAELSSVSNVKIKNNEGNMSPDEIKDLIEDKLSNDEERLIEEVKKHSESLAPDPEDAPRSSFRRKRRI